MHSPSRSPLPPSSPPDPSGSSQCTRSEHLSHASGKSTAVSEKEGMQLKDERDVVDVEDHGDLPRGAMPLSLGAPTKGRHSSVLGPQLPVTHMRGLFR